MLNEVLGRIWRGWSSVREEIDGRHKIGVRADRIQIVELGIREVQQRTDFAFVTELPPVRHHDVAVGIPSLGLVRVQLPEGSVELEALEVERATRANVDEAGDARLDQIGRRSLERLESSDRTRWEILQRDRARLRSEDFPAVIRGRVERTVEAAHEHPVRLAAFA